MPLSDLVQALLPILILIGIGYALARWAGLSTPPLVTLLRYVFLPVFLFMTIGGRMPFKMFFYVALIGAAVVGLGILISRNTHKFLNTKINPSVAVPNIALFSIPFSGLAFGGRGLGTACALFVGVALTSFFAGSKKKASDLLREPWIYAVVVGVIFREIHGSVSPMAGVFTPILGGTFSLLLIFLGTSLHPIVGFRDLGAWTTAMTRVLSGFLIAFLGISILPVTPAVATGVIFAAMAPPATKALSLSESGKDTPLDRKASNVGLVVSLAVLIFFMMTGWKPWQ